MSRHHVAVTALAVVADSSPPGRAHRTSSLPAAIPVPRPRDRRDPARGRGSGARVRLRRGSPSASSCPLPSRCRRTSMSRRSWVRCGPPSSVTGASACATASHRMRSASTGSWTTSRWASWTSAPRGPGHAHPARRRPRPHVDGQHRRHARGAPERGHRLRPHHARLRAESRAGGSRGAPAPRSGSAIVASAVEPGVLDPGSDAEKLGLKETSRG